MYEAISCWSEHTSEASKGEEEVNEGGRGFHG